MPSIGGSCVRLVDSLLQNLFHAPELVGRDVLVSDEPADEELARALIDFAHEALQGAVARVVGADQGIEPKRAPVEVVAYEALSLEYAQHCLHGGVGEVVGQLVADLA